MVSFFAEIDSISFWPKSLDYSKEGVLIKFFAHHISSLEGATELKPPSLCMKQ